MRFPLTREEEDKRRLLLATTTPTVCCIHLSLVIIDGLVVVGEYRE